MKGTSLKQRDVHRAGQAPCHTAWTTAHPYWYLQGTYCVPGIETGHLAPCCKSSVCLHLRSMSRCPSRLRVHSGVLNTPPAPPGSIPQFHHPNVQIRRPRENSRDKILKQPWRLGAWAATSKLKSHYDKTAEPHGFCFLIQLCKYGTEVAWEHVTGAGVDTPGNVYTGTRRVWRR